MPETCCQGQHSQKTVFILFAFFLPSLAKGHDSRYFSRSPLRRRECSHGTPDPTGGLRSLPAFPFGLTLQQPGVPSPPRPCLPAGAAPGSVSGASHLPNPLDTLLVLASQAFPLDYLLLCLLLLPGAQCTRAGLGGGGRRVGGSPAVPRPRWCSVRRWPPSPASAWSSSGCGCTACTGVAPNPPAEVVPHTSGPAHPCQSRRKSAVAVVRAVPPRHPPPPALQSV